MLLSEFDLTKQAVINPEDIITPLADMPKVAVSCYSCITFERMVEELDAEKWDARSLRNTDKLDEKDRVAMLALEAAVRIAL